MPLHNLHSCTHHSLPSDCMQLDSDIDIDLFADQTFALSSHQTRTITLHVVQSVSANIQIFCSDSVDLTIRLIMLSAQIVDLKLSVIVCGKNSNINIVGMAVLTGHQSATITTRQIHCGKNSQSRFVLQGLLSDHGRLHYDGMIRIEKDASGTFALQNNKNILLSDTAVAISIPNIEVLNHDVQCYHGAAVGKFDFQQMQYMQSRGCNEVLIQQLLVQALFADVLQGYKNKELILQNVYEKL